MNSKVLGTDQREGRKVSLLRRKEREREREASKRKNKKESSEKSRHGIRIKIIFRIQFLPDLPPLQELWSSKRRIVLSTCIHYSLHLYLSVYISPTFFSCSFFFVTLEGKIGGERRERVRGNPFFTCNHFIAFSDSEMTWRRMLFYFLPLFPFTLDAVIK